MTVVSFWSKLYFQLGRQACCQCLWLLDDHLAACAAVFDRMSNPNGSSKSCAVGVATVSLTSNPCASFWSHGSASAFHRKSQESLPKRRKTVDKLVAQWCAGRKFEELLYICDAYLSGFLVLQESGLMSEGAAGPKQNWNLVDRESSPFYDKMIFPMLLKMLNIYRYLSMPVVSFA